MRGSSFNRKQAGLFADWYSGGLNGPIDLKFGMYIVLGEISRYQEKTLKKIARKFLKMFISAFF